MDFLIIDDDKNFRDATCFLIEDAGHYAEGAETGELGLAALKEDKFDTILLDAEPRARKNKSGRADRDSKTAPADPRRHVHCPRGSVKTAVEDLCGAAR